jgi:hypothetical protein
VDALKASIIGIQLDRWFSPADLAFEHKEDCWLYLGTLAITEFERPLDNAILVADETYIMFRWQLPINATNV